MLDHYEKEFKYLSCEVSKQWWLSICPKKEVLVNSVKNPYNIKSGKYPLKGCTLPTLPFPHVFMAFHKTEKLQLCSFRMKTSAVLRKWEHTSDPTMAQKRLLQQTALCPGSQSVLVPWNQNDHTMKLWSTSANPKGFSLCLLQSV